MTISHFRAAAADQSLVLNDTLGQMTDAGRDVENIGGPLGAYLSHVIFTEWFGIGAFVIVAYLFLLGLSLLKLRKAHFWALTFKCLLLTVTISLVGGLVTFNDSSPIFWGGYHGHFANDYLIKVSGVIGALAVNLILILAVTCVYINDLRSLCRAYRRRVRAAGEQAPAKASQREAYDEPQTQRERKLEFTLEGEITDDPEPPDDKPVSEQNQGDVPMEIRTVSEIEEADRVDTGRYDPKAGLSRYRFPSLDLLHDRKSKTNCVDQQEQEENKERIIKTLNDYGITISQIKATIGPTVTLYEIVPTEGVRIAKIKRLEDDIAMSLAALGIRIIAPIPGKGSVGIEVPNKEPQTVSIRSIIASKKFQECNYPLPMAMGATIANEVFIADLTKMPHVLVAGATGQGKSVGLNAIIASLLYKKHPAELKFVLIDPKMVEFSLYGKLERHYLAKLPDEEEAIITDPMKAVATLNSLCVEMDKRYELLRAANVRSLAEYNAKFVEKRLNPEKNHRYLPFIVIIVDEFSDLIMMAGKEVERPIVRIAQKARAVGMHMIIATQRPSTDVITGIIKANFPCRIAFKVSQMVDSKTIIDRSGANQLIGRGDMLFSSSGEIERVQCAFIDTDEVEAICDCINEQIGFEHAYYLPEYHPVGEDEGTLSGLDFRDPLFEDSARFIITSQTASTSSLQRRYSIGYNRAGKIMDQMEAAGIVGPAQGGKPRQVLMDSLQLERLLEESQS